MAKPDIELVLQLANGRTIVLLPVEVKAEKSFGMLDYKDIHFRFDSELIRCDKDVDGYHVVAKERSGTMSNATKCGVEQVSDRSSPPSHPFVLRSRLYGARRSACSEGYPDN